MLDALLAAATGGGGVAVAAGVESSVISSEFP
jgi:hypothetical protein